MNQPMFALEIELLTGAYRAELPDRSHAEWPPHPERVFSALVQAWGDGGCDAKEREALEWLESLPAPLIEADDFADGRENRRQRSLCRPTTSGVARLRFCQTAGRGKPAAFVYGFRQIRSFVSSGRTHPATSTERRSM